ncbi:hypothetical protein B0A49_05788 [Cryomyces minteri]|uniref:Ribosome production factor 2 homolog n=1 Tax=Cryomyces minteri TaxID=331657 RepID=A0A4U0WXC8_9PEZI|nr:hypothetical protein B0A49_05788 [Cryomyces minteri]
MLPDDCPSKPRNARSKRALEKRAPLVTENVKITLFLRYTSCSEILQLVMKDLQSLKRPLAISFTKKNDIHPFDDPSSLEFFSEKNDTSLMVYGSHSKKRLHALTLIRFFSSRVLDMLELYVDPETVRTLSQFKNAKAAVGLKPLLAFSGTSFESPTHNAFTLAKSLFIDLFRGQDASLVDVEGLQYIISICAGEEVDGQPASKIHFRCYLIKTKRSGFKTPRVEVEEMGPRIDFRVGRLKEADDAIWKEALKKPRGVEAKTKKNVETDIIGDKVGRIHLGKQDLSNLQTRKMKGLKRTRDVKDVDDATMVDDDDVVSNDDGETKKVRL